MERAVREFEETFGGAGLQSQKMWVWGSRTVKWEGKVCAESKVCCATPDVASRCHGGTRRALDSLKP